MVAAGGGARFGGPKQYEALAGRRVLDWSVAAARQAVDGVVLVVPADRAEVAEPGADVVVAGGATRSASVRAGLDAVPRGVAAVVVHDAARPLASAALFRAVLGALPTAEERARTGIVAVVPAVPVTDTIKEVDDRGMVVRTPDRAHLLAVQTPQAFAAEALRAAHAGGGEATDDAALIEERGGRVQTVPGEERNTKITTPADLQRAADWLGAGVTAGAAAEPTRPGLRVGFGFDIHPFTDAASGRALVLGGVVLEPPAGRGGLAGHSDADAVAHAVTDAVLGAAGLEDIGAHFPDTDPRWRGADSLRLLAAAVALARDAGWAPVNVDCTVVLESPRLAPHRAAMQERLSSVVGAPVTVKAKRAEGLGALGRREGIACHAVALLGPLSTPPEGRL